MSDTRDRNEQLKINDADVRRADRTEAGTTGSTSADATDDNRSVLDDVAHPFDQTNGILDSYDETHPGNVTGESVVDNDIDDDTPQVPPPMPSAGR